MLRNKASLVFFAVYFIAVVVYLTAVTVDNYTLQLFSKPFVIPAIFMFYLLANNFKVPFVNIIIYLLFYSGEMYFLWNNNLPNLFQMITCNLGYILFITIQLEDVKQIPKKVATGLFKDFMFLVTISALAFLMIKIVISVELDSKLEFFIFCAFAVEFVLMIILSVLYNFYKFDKKGFFGVLTILSFILCNSFFVFNFYFYEHKIFELICAVFESFCYCFMTYYFISKSMNNENWVTK